MQDINYKNILREIKPSKQENEKVKKLSKRIVDVINESAASMDVKADAMLVGTPRPPSTTPTPPTTH